MNKILYKIYVSISMISALFIAACSNEDEFDGNNGMPNSETEDVVFNNFAPLTGFAGSTLLIRGDHFGEDISKVSVKIGNVDAHVNDVTNKKIEVVIPKDLIGEAVIYVKIERSADKIFEHAFETTFLCMEPVITLMVETLIGAGRTETDPAEKEVDGSYTSAVLSHPEHMVLDQTGCIFFYEWGYGTAKGGLRKAENNMVEMLYRKSTTTDYNIDIARGLYFDPTGDILYVLNEEWIEGGIWPYLGYFNREEDFKKLHNLGINEGSMTGLAVNPVDGEIFVYLAHMTCMLYRFNQTTKEKENIFQPIPGGMWYMGHLLFSKDGSKLYILMRHDDECKIFVADYDFENKTVKESTLKLLAGGTSGYQDGTGENAKFRFPTGADVDNGGNLYVADSDNHCIRKVTPEGEVITIAGQPTVSGFLDGPADEALFNGPKNIKIAPDGSFYVTDIENHRIRRIYYQ